MIDLFCRYLSIQLHFTLFCSLQPTTKTFQHFWYEFSHRASYRLLALVSIFNAHQNWTVFVSLTYVSYEALYPTRSDHTNCISDLSRPQEQPASTLSSFANFKTSFTSNVNFLKRRYTRESAYWDCLKNNQTLSLSSFLFNSYFLTTWLGKL